ncbi:MAG: AAA family ATPase [Clostridia bacterium]|nr:AAA family ATPase [Clostridia bacterium]
MKKEGLVLFVSGSSGVGKNTLIQGLLAKEGYKFISSYTTRAPRESDAPNQYQYISVADFEAKIKSNEILEYDIYNENYYGTSRKMFIDGLNDAKVVMKDVTVLGHKNIVEKMGNEVNLLSVFLTADKKVLKQRLTDRGEKPEKIKARLELYKKEQSQIPNYDFVIKNTVYLKSLEKLEKLCEVGLGNARLLPTKEYNKLSAKKIDKHAAKLEQGKILKPIKVAMFEGEIYIVDGVHRYLASLKTGKNVVKEFVDITPKNTQTNLEEWDKIVKAYTI